MLNNYIEIILLFFLILNKFLNGLFQNEDYNLYFHPYSRTKHMPVKVNLNSAIFAKISFRMRSTCRRLILLIALCKARTASQLPLCNCSAKGVFVVRVRIFSSIPVHLRHKGKQRALNCKIIHHRCVIAQEKIDFLHLPATFVGRLL